MDKQIQQSVLAAVAGFSVGETGSLVSEMNLEGDYKTFYENLRDVIEKSAPFKDKLTAMDDVFDANATFESLREPMFDLLLINFFATDPQATGDDYLESDEWEEIEDDTIDRGTEILNIFLYLKECKENDIVPELDDFLKEYLLVEDADFQDEHEIYEAVIANQALVDGSYAQIATVTAKVYDTSPVGEIFYPLIGFFYQINPTDQDLKDYIKHSANKQFDTAVLFAILAYYNGSVKLPLAKLN